MLCIPNYPLDYRFFAMLRGSPGSIKDHVFHQEHKLTGGIGRFDPDVDMMGAWQRLISNDFAHSDLLWLQHEFVESLIMNGLDVAYEEAHSIANKFYNWSNSLKGI